MSDVAKIWRTNKVFAPLLQTRQNSIHQIQNKNYDCIVIGGGVTGSGVLRDLSSRKIEALLIDKSDFASGTSSKSGKLIHGGLRYLRYMHISMVLESCLERNRLLRIVAPHIARPIQFVLPFFKESKTPRWLAAIGLALYDVLSLFRNTDTFKFVSKERCHILGKNFKTDSLVGGLSYWDSFCHDSRLVFETLKTAKSLGADLLNYTEFVAAKKDGEFWQIDAFCHLTKIKFEIKSKTIVSCAGPWCDDVGHKLMLKKEMETKITMGAHLIIDKNLIDLNQTISVEAPSDKRNVYFIPWGDRVLVGTTDRYYHGDKDDLPLTEEHCLYLLDVINYYFPKSYVQKKDILSFYVGIRPIVSDGNHNNVKEEKLPRDYKIISHPLGVLSVSGGKLTTYRSMAKKIVNKLVAEHLPEFSRNSCQTLKPLNGAINLKQLTESIPKDYEEVWANWVDRYGRGASQIKDIVEEQKMPELKTYIGETKVTWAELLYFVKEEWATGLKDILYRRTTIHLLSPYSGSQELLAVVKFLSTVLDIPAENLKKEMEQYKEEIKILF